MEEISLNLANYIICYRTNSGAIKISVDSPKKSVNFGPGAEMLMNKINQKFIAKSDINLDDLIL